MEDNYLQLRNRRYIGSKQKLVERIYEEIINLKGVDENSTIADVFAGTGIVAETFFKKGHNIIVNDLLQHNIAAYNTWLSNEDIDTKKVNDLIEKINGKLKQMNIGNNYFSDIYGDKYFSKLDAYKIGEARELIEKEKSKFNNREYSSLLTSLMYEVDKKANTVGHFEHYLSHKTVDKGIELRKHSIKDTKAKSTIFNMDANNLVREIEADIVYLDPPYNARQYINFYHVLENLVTWNKPSEFEGKSMKFKRNHLKSDYSKAKAPEAFKDLIENINAKYIVVSYNNTYKANSSASNNKISEEQMKSILKSRGKLRVIELEHKFFNAGKTDFKKHMEYLYICEVRNDIK